MAEFGLISTGFNRKRLVDLITQFQDEAKDLWGENIDLTPESNFSRSIAIHAEAYSKIWEIAEDVYNSQYPRTAQGVMLSNVVELNGIQRQPAEYSTVDLTFTGTAGTVIPAGFQVGNSNSYIYKTTEDGTIGAINVIIPSQSIEKGLFDSGAGTITEIINPLYGVDTATNVDVVTAGRFEESDTELRIRRESSVAIAGQNTKNALESQLLNIKDVFDAVVTSNGTNATVDGVPAHTFRSVVYGGLDADIGLAVWINTPQGILSSGAVSVVVVDSTGTNQTVKFTRPTAKPVYFDIDITVDSTKFIGTDTEIIKELVKEFGDINFKISDDVLASRFFIPIMSVEGVLDATIKLGFSSSPTNTANLAVTSEEISTYNTANIEVNII